MNRSFARVIIGVVCVVVLALFSIGGKSKSQSSTTLPAGNSATARTQPAAVKAPPAIANKPPQGWAILVHGAASLRPVLINHYGWKEDHVIVVKKPTRQELAEAFGKVPKLSQNDVFLFACCGPAAGGYVFNKQWPWREVDQQLRRIGAISVVVVENGNGGLAIEYLPSAEVVYSACDAFNSCGGIFMGRFVESLKDPAADADKDGRISLGEAFDAAANSKRLQEGYAELRKNNPKFWPTTRVPYPVRSPGRQGYRIYLDASVNLTGNEPAGSKEPAERWALLIYHGRSLRRILLERYGWKDEHIITVGKPTPENVSEAFAKIPKLRSDDLFVFSICHHAARRFLFNKQWPWAGHAVERELKRIGATSVVVLEICHGGLAMQHLPSAELVYSACDSYGKCGGIFKVEFEKALTNPASDVNHDGHISLGEAFDRAARREPLVEGYKNLRKNNPKFWPTTWVPIPLRSPGQRGYGICLEADWDLTTSKIWDECIKLRHGSN